MRVNGMLVTHDIPEEAMPWMRAVRDVFDELVIFIDKKRVSPGTEARAKEVGTRIHHHKADEWFQWDLAAMARACESDWVFIIERDEELSPEWRQGEWRSILERTSFTHFWTPRRWVVPSGEYIAAAPWWPDRQLRLVRNGVPGTTFPTRLHDAIHIPGRGGILRNLTIHHHVLRLCDRETREERVRYYGRLRPGGGLGHYYLYEDYSPPTAPLPAPSKLDVNGEILLMEWLSAEAISKISLRIGNVPQAISAGALFWLDAEVTNEANGSLYAAPPYPVSLAYHWLAKATRQLIVFDGNRSELFPGLRANETGRYQMVVAGPNEPGEYILQTTMVQDGVCWFEEIQPGIVKEFFVSVTR